MVTQDDKSHPEAAKKQIFIKHSTYYPFTANGTRQPTENTTAVTLDQDGTALFTVKPPLDAENIQISVQIIYD